jgi:hypothetical protein
MPLPRPQPGLVICYEFLWSHEHEAGATQGEKKRPCVVVLAVEDRMGQTIVTVAPVTHSEPEKPEYGIEMPRRVKAHLGLNEDRSWVITTDLNEFAWPGEHIFPVPGGRVDRYEYGFIPQALLTQITETIDRLAEADRHRSARDTET